MFFLPCGVLVRREARVDVLIDPCRFNVYAMTTSSGKALDSVTHRVPSSPIFLCKLLHQL